MAAKGTTVGAMRPPGHLDPVTDPRRRELLAWMLLVREQAVVSEGVGILQA